jgi:hypothetical protein
MAEGPMKGSLVILAALFLSFQPAFGGMTTCTIKCEDGGTVKQVEVKLRDMPPRSAELFLLKAVELQNSLAARYCREQGYRGISSKGGKLVECR